MSCKYSCRSFRQEYFSEIFFTEMKAPNSFASLSFPAPSICLRFPVPLGNRHRNDFCKMESTSWNKRCSSFLTGIKLIQRSYEKRERCIHARKTHSENSSLCLNGTSCNDYRNIHFMQRTGSEEYVYREIIECSPPLWELYLIEN